MVYIGLIWSLSIIFFPVFGMFITPIILIIVFLQILYGITQIFHFALVEKIERFRNK
jgi:hypothetical protein